MRELTHRGRSQRKTLSPTYNLEVQVGETGRISGEYLQGASASLMRHLRDWRDSGEKEG